MEIYVGNVPYRATQQELQTLFEEFGQVSSVSLPTDRETGQPRGFAFVSMPNAAEGKAAIESLDGREFMGRALRVNEARPREPGRGGPRR
ncbi:MAG: RNA-binding protein [Candidatus Latescibacterota bacterium]